MTEWEAVEKRISCRAYRDEPLPEEILRQLRKKRRRCARRPACDLGLCGGNRR